MHLLPLSAGVNHCVAAVETGGEQDSPGALLLDCSNLRNSTKKKDRLVAVSFFLVDLKGFEPSTPAMRMRCAPNCATSPYYPAIIPPGILFVKAKTYRLMAYSTGVLAGSSSSSG